MSPSPLIIFFFFNDTATTEIYTLSLHDALPIFSSLPNHQPEQCSVSIPVKCENGRMRGWLRWERSEEHTSELQSPDHLVCRLLLEKKKNVQYDAARSYHVLSQIE